MLNLTKRIVILATVVLAASAPSAAYAKFAAEGHALPATLRAQTARTAAPVSAGIASGLSSPGFQWGDAGIGAASVLMLVSVGSGAMIVRRRRTHHPLTS